MKYIKTFPGAGPDIRFSSRFLYYYFKKVDIMAGSKVDVIRVIGIRLLSKSDNCCILQEMQSKISVLNFLFINE